MRLRNAKPDCFQRPTQRQYALAPRRSVAPSLRRMVERPPAKIRAANSDVVGQLPSISLSMDDDILMARDLACSGTLMVLGVMKPQDPVLTARPDDTLQDVIPKLAKLGGVPVVDDTGRVTGLIGRRDIIRVRKAGGSMDQLVRPNMTSPANIIRETSPVQDAADLMLHKKTRMLVVVDQDERPLGVVSRTDIFKPLFEDALQAFLQKEQEAVNEGTGVSVSLASRPTWAIKYLYDGECSMCQALVAVLQRNDKRNRINYINIQGPGYYARDNMGVEVDEAMQTIHAIYANGVVVRGTVALQALFDEVGLGWATRLSEIPVISWIVEVLYEFLSHNRIALGSAMDAIIASKRVSKSKAGVEVCTADVEEGCEVDW